LAWSSEELLKTSTAMTLPAPLSARRGQLSIGHVSQRVGTKPTQAPGSCLRPRPARMPNASAPALLRQHTPLLTEPLSAAFEA